MAAEVSVYGSATLCRRCVASPKVLESNWRVGLFLDKPCLFLYVMCNLTLMAGVPQLF